MKPEFESDRNLYSGFGRTGSSSST